MANADVDYFSSSVTRDGVALNIILIDHMDDSFATGIGRTRQQAQHMLRDFAQSGVDEELEQLKAMWKKPPTPESDEEDAEAMLRGLDGRRPWRGVCDRPRPPPAFARIRPPREQRVRGGSLDYQSTERLGMLKVLRHAASNDSEVLLTGIKSMAIVQSSSASSRPRRPGTNRRPADGETDIEREARLGSGYHPHMDWADWERKWAAQLRDLAAAAERAARHDASFSETMGAGGLDDEDVDSHPRRSQRHSPHPSARQQYARPSPGGSRRPGSPPPPPQPRSSQQPRQAPPEPPPPREAPRRPQATQATPPPPVGRQFAAWGAFDSAFKSFEAGLATANVVRLAEVPFPPANDPAGLAEAGVDRGTGAAATRKKLLHKALLRWHPDKWARVLSKASEADASGLHERLREITQALLAQKE